MEAFLVSKHANGTPVTVWYVLSEPEEETIKLSEIPTIKGANTLDINTQVYLKYKGR